MNAMTTELAPSQANRTMLMDPPAFEQMQRVAKMLALSPLFPAHLRPNAETGIANGVLVMNMALRLNEDVLTVAQNIYFVSGRPGWNATYMIAKANMSGKFIDPIDWDIEGEGDSLAVTAYAVLAGTGKRVAVTVSMKMAKAEGWIKNPKYQSMPEQMLRYRSATFLIRLYCPDVMIGVPSTADELEDEGMRDVTPKSVFTEPAATAPRKAAAAKAAPVTVEATVATKVEPTVQQATTQAETKAATVATGEPKQEAMALDTAPAEGNGATDAPAANPQRAKFDALVKGLKAAEDIEQANAVWNGAESDWSFWEMEHPDLFAEICDIYDRRAAALTA